MILTCSSLGQWLKNKHKEAAEAKKVIISQIAKDLAFIHGRSIVLRGIKNANIAIEDSSDTESGSNDPDIRAIIRNYSMAITIDNGVPSQSEAAVDILSLRKVIEEMYPKPRTMPDVIRAWCDRFQGDNEEMPTVQDLVDAVWFLRRRRNNLSPTIEEPQFVLSNPAPS